MAISKNQSIAPKCEHSLSSPAGFEAWSFDPDASVAYSYPP